MTQDERLIKAKRDYPPGTKFFPAHLSQKVKDNLCTVKEGEIFSVNSIENIGLSWGNRDKNGHNFSELVYADGNWAKIYEKKENKKNTLIQEAYRRFPSGTKFTPAHIAPSSDKVCLVAAGDVFNFLGNTITIGPGNFERNGHSYSEHLYYEGKWAKIVTKSIESTKPIEVNSFKIGDEVIGIDSTTRKNPYGITRKGWTGTVREILGRDIIVSISKDSCKHRVQAKYFKFYHEKLKFKQGDRIIGLPSASERYSKTTEGWIGIITEINSSGHFRAIREDGARGFPDLAPEHFKLYPKEFEKVEVYDIPDLPSLPNPPITKSKFKVGDTVVGNGSNSYDFTGKGWIGQITYIHNELKMEVAPINNLKNTFNVNQDKFDLHDPGAIDDWSDHSALVKGVNTTEIKPKIISVSLIPVKKRVILKQ